MHFIALVAVALTASPSPCSAAPYTLQNNISGTSFFDNFDFYNQYDPTFGFVEYVDRGTAEALALFNVTDKVARFGVDAVNVYDPYANKGRKSLRLTSKQTWTHGLFILDLQHMPGTACGTWPAFWILGNGPLLWPRYGEIDIIEYTNQAKTNLMALHAMPGCTIAGSGQTGKLLTNDCGEDDGYKGCNVEPAQPNSAGTAFNSNGGGYFPRDGIPSELNSSTPDPERFGVPTANFQGSCDIDKYFSNGNLVFDIDFCGTWAGPTFNMNTSCPVLDPANQWTSCNMFVGNNPQAFTESYWAVNYLHVYQLSAGATLPASTSLASVTPAESTSSVSASGAEGRSTTTDLSTTSTPVSLSLSTASSTVTTSGSTSSSSSTPSSETTSSVSSSSTSETIPLLSSPPPTASSSSTAESSLPAVTTSSSSESTWLTALTDTTTLNNPQAITVTTEVVIVTDFVTVTVLS